MEKTEALAKIIANRLEEHQRRLAEQQQQTDATMKELLEQRERFSAVATRVIASVVHPRMEELLRHFDNASIMDTHGDTDYHCSCNFSHTPRFPATVTLDFGILPAGDSLTARYDLQIFPILMEYKHDQEKTFSLEGSDEAIGSWVEERIGEFLDAYLRLETHPLYQKDNLVTDPVCGMRIPAIAATSKLEWPGHTIYFCSDLCRDAFQKQNK